MPVVVSIQIAKFKLSQYQWRAISLDIMLAAICYLQLHSYIHCTCSIKVCTTWTISPSLSESSNFIFFLSWEASALSSVGSFFPSTCTMCIMYINKTRLIMTMQWIHVHRLTYCMYNMLASYPGSLICIEKDQEPVPCSTISIQCSIYPIPKLVLKESVRIVKSPRTEYQYQLKHDSPGSIHVHV
jgi:hypothetical protein